MEYINRTCRLCLKNYNSTFKVLDEMVQFNLNSIQLYLDLTVSNEPVLCETCTENLKHCLDFIAKCMLNIDTLRALVFDENHSNDYNICRFCLNVGKYGTFTCLDNSDIEMVWKHFPDLYFDISEPSVVCTECYKLLHGHLSFLKCCSQTEEKITEYCRTEGTNSKGVVDLSCVANFVPKDMLKDDKGLIKIDETLMDNESHLDTNNEVKKECDVEIKQEMDGQLESVDEIKIEPVENNSLKSITPSSQINSISKETSHNCTICSFQSKYKKNLRKHLLAHKNDNKANVHNCLICEYQTKHKYDYIQHMRIHKSCGEVTMYRCTECIYDTKYKKGLFRHMIIHKSSSEIVMYRCTECRFETKYKTSLSKHMVSHKGMKPTGCNLETTQQEVRLDNMPVCSCAECGLEFKSTYLLNRHLVVHKKNTEVTMHKCTLCGFQTKHKYNLGGHMVIHKDISEATLYKCMKCNFESKHKRSLYNHMLMHKSRELVEGSEKSTNSME